MRARFLLGPAGSGKTHGCLEEIRAELAARPAGRPLIFLAPKQATFQIERQLLGEGGLPGYARLQILSFERLADLVLNEAASPPAPLISEEGRIMVLRALLATHQGSLKIFHAAARMPGFARQVSLLLRELQRHQLSAAGLTRLAARPDFPAVLRGKLQDLSCLLAAYQGWLAQAKLRDAHSLLDLATAALRGPGGPGADWGLDGLWLDGFAEMTPQELDFLAALAPRTRQVCLAFCLENPPREELPWRSTWSLVAHTYRQCRARLEAVTGEPPEVVVLRREPGRGRFAANPALAHLEANWALARPAAFPEATGALRLVACANPEAEAVLAAREIVRHVRAGGRYREAAVLLRRLETHVDALRRVFRRYEIPFFVDQREAVAHHPLAELTRYAVRTVAFHWQHEDWFGALKSGLVRVDEARLDELENAALEHGWAGADWQSPLAFPPDAPRPDLEELRAALLAPFVKFRARLEPGPDGQRFAPTGAQLAAALRELWDELQVSRTLESWAQPAAGAAADAPAIHATVWHELHDWLDNLELAFRAQPMSLRDWLPVLEAGLGQLSVGVIPPALDQVLVGAVDRSRNPDLQLALVLGLNETIFPAPPAPAPVLSEEEREALAGAQAPLGAHPRLRLGHERYYGYIACTRARSRLVITWSETGASGAPLNPSMLVDLIRARFPQVPLESFAGAGAWADSEHLCEVICELLRPGHPLAPHLESLAAELRPLREYRPDDALSPAAAEALYGRTLATSVSAMERFGMCPFQFFIGAGLRAERRTLFEADVFRLGSFQHEALAKFHEALAAEGRRWRDLAPAEARQRMADIVAALAPDFNLGLFEATAQNRFTRDVLGQALQDLVEMMVQWMSTYQFDPARVELSFGLKDAAVPAWALDLGEGRTLLFRGQIDRIDTCPGPQEGELLCVVMDYKSSARKLDPLLLEHGIQLQLPAYLSVLRHVPEMRAALGAQRLVPAGIFYVNLRGKYESGGSRAEALTDPDADRRQAYQHQGRFDASWRARFDASPAGASGQFLGAGNGGTSRRQTDALPPEQFQALLDKVEENLRRMGGEIFCGTARLDPYQKGTETACDKCEFQAICRIDPWTHPFRRLRPPTEEPPADPDAPQ